MYALSRKGYDRVSDGGTARQRRRHKMDSKAGYVVMGIRHFMNGEHHWITPERMDEAMGCAEGEVIELEGYGKPVFANMKDAERFAMSLAHGEWRLAQWESGRPTWYVVDVDSYLFLVEKDSYALPEESESWSDAKMADFERECDCEDIVNLALWDSVSDEDRVSESVLKVMVEINGIDGLAAWVEDGMVAVSPTKPMNKEAVADCIESVEGFPSDEVRWVASDETVNTAWYEVK